MYSKIYIRLFAIIVASFTLNGCLEPPTPETLIAKSSDKEMMRTMTSYVKWGSHNPDIINHEVYISQVKGHTDTNQQDILNDYKAQFDASSEKMTQDYIKTAKARGNIVKLYNNSVNLALSNITPRSFSIENGWDAPIYELDPAFIEFDKSGGIVTAMLQKHKISRLQLGNSVQFLHYRYTEIITGNSAKKIQYSVGNNILDNGYIKTF
jgi:hypothetical protein